MVAPASFTETVKALATKSWNKRVAVVFKLWQPDCITEASLSSPNPPLVRLSSINAVFPAQR